MISIFDADLFPLSFFLLYTHTDAIDHRLVIAVTKRDQRCVAGSKSSNFASEDEVAEKVCTLIQDAAKSAIKNWKRTFSQANVITLSASWALKSNQLLLPKCDELLKVEIAFQLCLRPGVEGGQGENSFSGLQKLSPEMLANKLKKASGITDLEQRYMIDLR